MRVFRSSGGGAQAPVASSSVAIVYRIAETPSNAHTSLNSSHPAPQDFAPPASTPPPPHAFHRYSQSQGVAYEAPVLPPRQSMVIPPSLFMSGNSGNNTPPPDTSFPTSAYTMPPRDAQPTEYGCQRRPTTTHVSFYCRGDIRSEAVAVARQQACTAGKHTRCPGAGGHTTPIPIPRASYGRRTGDLDTDDGVSLCLVPTSPPPTAWGPFFETDMSPSPVFTVLMDAIFAYLDTRRTGSLTPEVYSRFLLINQGYLGKQNICAWPFISRKFKLILISQTQGTRTLSPPWAKPKKNAPTPPSKRAFDLFGIQYILRPRARDAPSPPADVKSQFQSLAASFARAISPATPAAGMPLLTRTGFLNITAVEVLCDPARHYTGLAHVVQMYESGLGAVVRGWGTPLPRGVLPGRTRPEDVVDIVVGGQSGQSGPGRLGSGVAGGLLSAAAYTRNAVGKIDAQGAVIYGNSAKTMETIDFSVYAVGLPLVSLSSGNISQLDTPTQSDYHCLDLRGVSYSGIFSMHVWSVSKPP
ncbi:hypothetical protein B0H14DRAFT_3499194 [Mycena olivaceomarginata]|nr:hypothetical protein B0H14DRAFT_3499194 [Mycena olivaceomarginata]